MADYSWNYPIKANDFALSTPQLNHIFEIAGEWWFLLWLCTIWNRWNLLLAGGFTKIGCVSLFTPYFMYWEIGYFGNTVVSHKMLRVRYARDSPMMMPLAFPFRRIAFRMQPNGMGNIHSMDSILGRAWWSALKTRNECMPIRGCDGTLGFRPGFLVS